MNFRESTKIWNSISERHTLFWTDCSAKEERVIRLARIGTFITGILLGLLTSIEILFFLILLWEIVR